MPNHKPLGCQRLPIWSGAAGAPPPPLDPMVRAMIPQSVAWSEGRRATGHGRGHPRSRRATGDTIMGRGRHRRRRMCVEVGPTHRCGNPTTTTPPRGCRETDDLSAAADHRPSGQGFGFHNPWLLWWVRYIVRERGEGGLLGASGPKQSARLIGSNTWAVGKGSVSVSCVPFDPHESAVEGRGAPLCPWSHGGGGLMVRTDGWAGGGGVRRVSRPSRGGKALLPTVPGPTPQGGGATWGQRGRRAQRPEGEVGRGAPDRW